MIPILQIRKLRCRERKCLAERCPTASCKMALGLDGALSGVRPGLSPPRLTDGDLGLERPP